MAEIRVIKLLRLGLCLVCLATALICESDVCADQQRPNVVLILADDLGWSDTTLFGTTRFYRTPNIQRLAARGLTFTRAYSSSPLCSPTRAAILTGLSPARTGITSPNCHLPNVLLQATSTATAPANCQATTPDSVSRLDTKYYTLAEMFRDIGYATAHFGKWHLGPPPYSPLEHGFEVDVPHWPGPGPAGSYVAPWKFPNFDPHTASEHLEDRMAAEAVAFMKVNRDKPFFLNYWMFSVHAPFDAKRELIEKYREQVDADDPQRCPTYAAMIESMDDAVGTLLDTLDELQLANNTIIVFASDNGGNMYNEVDGTTVTSNLPLRGGKATMYEGGTRGPAIVVHPGVVKPGSRSDAVIQSSDFYPTLLELLDIPPQPDQKFDGISIVPALLGKPLPREAIFTYFPHNPRVPEWLPPAVSVHRGDWKLIRIFFGGEQGAHRYQLFNLQQDLGETTNVAAKFPDLVKELDVLIDSFLKDAGAVLPLPNPNFDPTQYQPELEGQGQRKGSGAGKPTASAKQAARQTIAGWRASGTCELSISDGTLVVESNGGDPHLSFQLPTKIARGPLTLKFRMSSDSVGKGQVFWQEEGVAPAFFRDRSVSFDVQHDGKEHDYVVQFTPSQPILAIRIDPSTDRGTIRISSIGFADGLSLFSPQ